MTRKIISCLLVFCLVTPVSYVGAESVDEEFTHISPKHSPGGGEFVHGQGYGKILVRVLMFGAIPQQGIHYVPEGTDMLFGILYAGGYGDNTKMNNITVRRKGVPELIHVDLESIIEEGAAIPKLKDGDIVNVPYNWRRDYQEFMFFTSIFSSLTGLVISLAFLTR
jgi:hypothetical protein